MTGVIKAMLTLIAGAFGLVAMMLVGAAVLDPIAAFVVGNGAVQATYGESMVTDIQRSVLQWVPLTTMAVLGATAVVYLLRREQFVGRR